MIYRCWLCGWRINQRVRCQANPALIGTHKLFEHRPFCNDFCIEQYKIRKTKPVVAPCSDWDELKWKAERRERKRAAHLAAAHNPAARAM